MILMDDFKGYVPSNFDHPIFACTVQYSSSSNYKLLYLHDRKILQYCKSIFIVINNKTRLIVL